MNKQDKTIRNLLRKELLSKITEGITPNSIKAITIEEKQDPGQHEIDVINEEQQDQQVVINEEKQLNEDQQEGNDNECNSELENNEEVKRKRLNAIEVECINDEEIQVTDTNSRKKMRYLKSKIVGSISNSEKSKKAIITEFERLKDYRVNVNDNTAGK